MGVAQSALHGQAALVSLNGQKSCHKLLQGDVQVEESGRGSPDVFMIEPVPEGLEHVVYPKYEEAFRLGLKAFNNPMRVNKFARPLPHILGSDASRRDSNAGIIPVAKPSGSSGIQTTLHSTPFGEPPRSMMVGYRNAAGSASPAQRREEEIENGIRKGDVQNFGSSNPDLKQQSPKAPSISEKRISSSDGEISEGEKEGDETSEKLDPASSLQALSGGLFDCDEEMSTALENYRQTHSSVSKSKKASDEATRLPQLARGGAERSQVSRDLERLGKSINDLQQQRAAGNK